MAVLRLLSCTLLVLVQHGNKVWGHELVNMRCEVPTHNAGSGTIDTKTKEKVAELEKKHLEVMNKIRLQQKQLFKCDTSVSNLTNTLGIALEKIKRLEEKSSVVKVCPRGFVELGGGCYYYSTDRKTWPQAQEHCQSLSANLATITSKDENQIIATNASDPYQYLWIGANDQENEGRWAWVATNSTLTFTNWAEGEPNNTHGGTEHCGQIYGKQADYKWNDERCFLAFRFVCEFP